MNILEEVLNEKHVATDYGLVSIIMPNYNSEKYIEVTISL